MLDVNHQLIVLGVQLAAFEHIVVERIAVQRVAVETPLGIPEPSPFKSVLTMAGCGIVHSPLMISGSGTFPSSLNSASVASRFSLLAAA